MKIIKNTALLSIFAAIITLVLKFGAYYLTGSLGLFSDAMESFVNVGSGLMLFFVLAISVVPADEKHNYGHDKAEYFAAGAEGILIIVAALMISYMAIERMFMPVVIQQLVPGLVVAALATVINIITAKLMLKVALKYDSVALESSSQHIMADVLTTVCVFIGLSIIQFAPAKLQIVDPIIAIIVAFYILFTGIKLIQRSINGLMDVALPKEDKILIKQAIQKQLPANAKVSDFRTRKAGAKRFIEFKLLLAGAMTVEESHEICDAIEVEIEKCFAKAMITIHVEPLAGKQSAAEKA